MTLSPIDNRRVRGVAAERYPLNAVCAHPECGEAAEDPHHIWRRSAIGNNSWFVEINYGLITVEGQDGYGHDIEDISDPVPHVVGLCRAHHDLVTRDEAWIRLEEDTGGWRFVWYDRQHGVDGLGLADEYEWKPIGPLDPQPAGRAKSHKPKRKRKTGEAKRRRTTISIKVPQDEQEDGAGIWDDYVSQCRDELGKEGLDPDRPVYYILIDVMADWLSSR